MKVKQVFENKPSLNRRRFLLTGGVAAAAGTIGVAYGRGGMDSALRNARFHADNVLGQGEGADVWYRYKFVDQAVMDAQLMFYLGLASSGLTEIGEVLDTATRISRGDERSWFDAWLNTAGRLRAYGEESLRRGHELSAGSYFFRAASYFRAGLMRYPDHADPRLLQATKDTLVLHDRALKIRGYESHEVKIPYENSYLFGRMHYAPNVDRAATIIMHQGLHAWPEDTMWVVDGALARGYHVLTFHGPGQGASLRFEGHPFRPDWEEAVSKVIDFAENEVRIARNKLVLMGLSFGGYLASRAASYEQRLFALIANPGVVSWADSMLRHFHAMPGLMSMKDKGPQAFDLAIAALQNVMPDARWYFDDATWKHGVDSPRALLDELAKYDNRDGVPKIRCKTLVMEGAAEDATPGEAKRFFDALQCDKHWLYFDEASAAQVHCQGGNVSMGQTRLFDWLDEEVGSNAAR